MSEKAQGKKMRKKEKALRKQVQAPTYLEYETGADQQRVNPYAYYKSTDLVEPVKGLEEIAIRTAFAPTQNKENFRLTEIAPERIDKIGKQVKLQEKAFLGHQLASWAIDNEKPGFNIKKYKKYINRKIDKSRKPRKIHRRTKKVGGHRS